ncbi:hypothetical protein BD311DRAFT_647410 [Dichomitus squalens]|uniref:Uncharacterized protein n=1 Tax=Dichomitus squalens TaxID=114155 RepID=A0A4Q9N8F9_9APHY|nr:hypothetical protein BD311DRAFT_647410 [Dichomitus squalens]
MYDYPLTATSSTPPSPQYQRKHHRRRSQSPLPHLATLLPTHQHEYSPSSRAADISRLLDPAYASSSTSSSSVSASPASPQTRVYVDHHGEIHDPDYRDFPVLRPTALSSYPGKHRRPSASSAARSRSHDRYVAALQPPRPSWERDWGTEVDDSDDDDDNVEGESQSHFSPFASHHGTPRRNTSQSAFAFSSSYPSSYYYFTEKAPATSSPDSYEGEFSNALQLHESPFEDDVGEVIEESRKTASLIRKVSKPKKSATLEVQPEKDEEDESSPALRPLDEEGDEDEHASTPTCTHLLRQQWQAISLRVRFGVYHAKRKILPRQRRA